MLSRVRLPRAAYLTCCNYLGRSLSTAPPPQPQPSPPAPSSTMALPPQPYQTRVEHVIPSKYRPTTPLETGLELKFAVINIKSKQYKVTKDDIIVSDKVEGLEPGSTHDIEEVHLVGTPDYTIVGRPYVQNAKVQLQVEEQTKDAKVIIFKKKRRKGYKRKMGFRREVTIFRVVGIEEEGSSSHS